MTTITEAFAAWQKIRAELTTVTTDAEAEALAAQCFEIETAAIDLPAETAQDVWRLVAMTTDKGNPVPRLTGDALVSRAHAEAA